jgi:hypothetical protein
MNLEHVSAEKSAFVPTASRPKPIQLSIFPKISLRPDYRVSQEQIERIIRRMNASGLCGRQKVRDYLRRQLRHNCRPNTIRSSGSTILLFLEFFMQNGGQHLAAIGCEHISAFVEHEQDRGMAPVSVDGRLKGLYAFLSFLVDQDVIGAEVIKRKLRKAKSSIMDGFFLGFGLGGFFLFTRNNCGLKGMGIFWDEVRVATCSGSQTIKARSFRPSLSFFFFRN